MRELVQLKKLEMTRAVYSIRKLRKAVLPPSNLRIWFQPAETRGTGAGSRINKHTDPWDPLTKTVRNHDS